MTIVSVGCGHYSVERRMILEFLRGRGTDARGRCLADMWSMDFDELESRHDFVQWMFPLDQRSQFVLESPVLGPDEVAVLKNDSEARACARRSLDAMLAFYGLSRQAEPGGGRPPSIVRAPSFAARRPVWMTPCNHNYRRLTPHPQEPAALRFERRGARALRVPVGPLRRFPGSHRRPVVRVLGRSGRAQAVGLAAPELSRPQAPRRESLGTRPGTAFRLGRGLGRGGGCDVGRRSGWYAPGLPCGVPGSAFVLGALMAGITGCADIWGFEDAIDPRDGGAPDAAQGTCHCVAAVPVGWRGPLEIVETSDGADAPACGSIYGSEAYAGSAGPDASAATCSCSCGPPNSACGPPAVTYFRDGMCTQSCGPSRQELGAGCTSLDVGNCNGGVHFTVAAPVAMPGGQCAPVASQTLPPVTWASHARLCAPTLPAAVAACGAGQVCAAATDLAFEPSTYCVMRAGQWPCPQDFPRARTYYDGSVADQRTCSTCTCGAPAGGTCQNATVSVGSGPVCSTGSAITTPSLCAPLAGMSVAEVTSGMDSVGGACPPAGGKASGTVIPTTPTSVCCTL